MTRERSWKQVSEKLHSECLLLTKLNTQAMENRIQNGNYQPRSEGDHVLGSVRPSVRPSVRQSAFSGLNRLTYDLDTWYVG